MMLENYTLKDLVASLRSFKGLTRKSSISTVTSILGETKFDDAGVIEVDGFKVVVSTDGIVEALVRDDPWLAGYYSVVVNVNDVVAKGARPVGYMNVISSRSKETRERIARGIKQGLSKYGLKLLKGHLHPDTSYDSVDAAVVGVTKNFIPGHTAKVGDYLVMGVDLDGRFGAKSWVLCFDSTATKPSGDILDRLDAMVEIAEKRLAHAARDISSPGIIGTIGMLCESSRVGAQVKLDLIPKPQTVKLKQWLMTYPSIGFIVSTSKPEDCVAIFEKHGLTASTIGKIVERKVILLSHGTQRQIFINLNKESIFGVRSPFKC